MTAYAVLPFLHYTALSCSTADKCWPTTWQQSQSHRAVSISNKQIIHTLRNNNHFIAITGQPELVGTHS